MTAEAPRWRTRAEAGNRFWFHNMLWAARHLGRRGTRWILYPTATYFGLANRDVRRVSREFLGRALGRRVAWRDVVRHMLWFATVVLDRVLIILGRGADLDVHVHQPDHVRRVAYGERGCLLFTSHLGSFEVMRGRASARGRIRVLLDAAHHARMGALLEMNPEIARAMIDARGGGPGVVLAVKQALDQGDRVGIMVDRPAPGEATVEAEFLGRRAPFPTGPWLVAASLKAPVVLCFGLYAGGNRYDVHFELFTESLQLSRANRQAELEAVIQRYAARLEHYARLSPYNWFNFYDFWK
jgi:predicted LPLAT superfamily acyltransferase